MYQHAIAALAAAPIDAVRRASFPTEPQALFVYGLVFVALWVIWKGHRRSGGHSDGRDGPPSDGSDPGSASASRGGGRTGTPPRE